MAKLHPFASTGSPAVAVPAGRRLIVETLSVQVDVSPSGSKLEALVNFTSAGQNVILFFPVSYAYTDPGTGFDFHVGLKAVRLYPDPGTSIEVTIHSPGGQGGTLFVTVSGRLT